MKRNEKIIDRLRSSALVLALLAAFAPALAQIAGPVPPSIEDLRKSGFTGQSEAEVKLSEALNLRAKAMREAAMSYGARSGLLRRTYEIRQALEKTSAEQDAVYNFVPLMLTDFQPNEKADMRARLVIPPVIVETGRTFNQEGGYLIRQRDKILKIESNAKFAAVAPNWRQYLLRDLGESVATLPHVSLLPRTSGEKADWMKWVEEGYAAGKVQADSIYDSDLNRLVRDLEGMIRYHELVEQKVVSLPYVATRNDGVTGDGNQLNINDVTLRITVMPAFQTNPKDWKPTATR